MDDNNRTNKELKGKGNGFLTTAMILMMIGMCISATVMINDWSFHIHEDFFWTNWGEIAFTVLYAVILYYQARIIKMIVIAGSKDIDMEFAGKLKKRILICLALNILTFLYCIVDLSADTVQGYFTMGQIMFLFQFPGIITKCIALVGAERLQASIS